MNRTTNSDGGEEFSRNDELSFYCNDELSDVGNEFYSPDENLAHSLKIGLLLRVSFFSRHQIPLKYENLTPLERFPSLSLTKFHFLKNLPSSKSVIAIHIPSGVFQRTPLSFKLHLLIMLPHMHLDDSLRPHDNHVVEHFFVKVNATFSQRRRMLSDLVAKMQCSFLSFGELLFSSRWRYTMHHVMMGPRDDGMLH